MIHQEDSYKIIGVCLEVHNVLGPGFLEIVYKDALEIEFQRAGINYEREKTYQIDYKGHTLNHTFQADFVIEDKIILEVKAVSEIRKVFEAQCINYLKASKLNLAILANFGESRFVQKRLVL